MLGSGKVAHTLLHHIIAQNIASSTQARAYPTSSIILLVGAISQANTKGVCWQQKRRHQRMLKLFRPLLDKAILVGADKQIARMFKITCICTTWTPGRRLVPLGPQLSHYFSRRGFFPFPFPFPDLSPPDESEVLSRALPLPLSRGSAPPLSPAEGVPVAGTVSWLALGPVAWLVAGATERLGPDAVAASDNPARLSVVASRASPLSGAVSLSS